MRDEVTTLVDGRTLAYTDLGDTSAPVVMYFHGAPTSRLDLVAYEDAFIDRGLRVISPDRPGYGRSSPSPGRSMHDWPTDVAALADQLRIDRFVVVGLSAGGPYAVACGALVPERVVGVGIANGVTDMGWPPAWDGFDPVDASIMRLGDEAAARRWMDEHYGADGSLFFSYTTLAPSDEALLEDRSKAQTLLATIVESFRQGVGGLAEDLTIQGRPWPFDPSAVRAPTIVLHGEDDPYLPVAHGRHTADLIPNARLVVVRGQGHVILIREIPQLCADLLGLAREAAP